ncbi:Type 1 glutamine amidotransferase-like domain-containing protein [Streptomyces sp. NPDC056529]|uniref:Type 1 glutamine amidotransferase-like domain-containing protein n=1 Tax=Streptomyces sp. NPDC056529 TaxID=3345855 RepID=UPI00367AE604
MCRAPPQGPCVPTADGDVLRCVERFLRAFRSRPGGAGVAGVVPARTHRRGTVVSLLSQNVIYVGGGSTADMPVVRRVHGVDRLLREALDRGVLPCGISTVPTAGPRVPAPIPSAR